MEKFSLRTSRWRWDFKPLCLFRSFQFRKDELYLRRPRFLTILKNSPLKLFDDPWLIPDRIPCLRTPRCQNPPDEWNPPKWRSLGWSKSPWFFLREEPRPLPDLLIRYTLFRCRKGYCLQKRGLGTPSHTERRSGEVDRTEWVPTSRCVLLFEHLQCPVSLGDLLTLN